MPVHDRDEVEEPRRIGIYRSRPRTPHLARVTATSRSRYGKHLVFRVGTAGVRTPIYRLQAHLAYSDAIGIHSARPNRTVPT